jgi:hypothetical protein
MLHRRSFDRIREEAAAVAVEGGAHARTALILLDILDVLKELTEEAETEAIRDIMMSGGFPGGKMVRVTEKQMNDLLKGQEEEKKDDGETPTGPDLTHTGNYL